MRGQGSVGKGDPNLLPDRMWLALWNLGLIRGGTACFFRAGPHDLGLPVEDLNCAHIPGEFQVWSQVIMWAPVVGEILKGELVARGRQPHL